MFNIEKYILVVIVLASVFALGCTVQEKYLTDAETPNSEKISSFEECVANGNPVMESYPRQCMAGGITFTEKIDESDRLTFEEAKEIAENSECMENMILTDYYVYNSTSKTWWIDLDMVQRLDLDCNPVCVVREQTKTAKIKQRCNTLI